MSRKEIFVLVSRALACIQLISALLYGSYLPDRLVSFVHHANQLDNSSTAQHFIRLQDSVSLFTLALRITILLVAFVIFWNCGPRVARALLPSADEQV